MDGLNRSKLWPHHTKPGGRTGVGVVKERRSDCEPGVEVTLAAGRGLSIPTRSPISPYEPLIFGN